MRSVGCAPRRRQRGRRLLVTLLLIVIGPAAARADISYAAERELGRKFALDARAQLPLLDDPEIHGYVDRIGQRIVATLGNQPFTYHFAVVRDASINAFAVPGGYIYVHAGLLLQAANDDEVAGVLAHEVAHVNAHHLARQRDSTQLLNYATLMGVFLSILNPAVGAGAAAANAAVQLQYQREFEQEADYLGAGYVQQAGYDARGMLDFFKKLLDQQHVTPTFAPPYLLSHPLTEVRLNNLEAVLRTHQWDRGARAPRSLELDRVQLLTRARSMPARDVMDVYWREAAAHPADGRVRYLLGLAYLETGAYDAARETLEASRRLGFASVDRELGRTLFRLRNDAGARELLSRAAEVDPDDPIAHEELAKVLEVMGDSAGAMREYEQALRAAPSLEEAHYSLGMLAGRTGHEGDGLYHLAKALMLRGEYDKALNQFERAEPLLPQASEQAQDTHAAIADLAEYLHRRPR